MIREFKIEDKQIIKAFLENEGISEHLKIEKYSVKDNNKLLIYEEENKIKGISGYSIYNEGIKKCRISIYVSLEERKRGIGTKLYEEMIKYLDSENLDELVTEFEVNSYNPTDFYKKLGYEKWFGCEDMIYRGKEVFESTIEMVGYEDKYYNQYVKCIQDGFYELRKENDIKPYLCDFNEKDRDILLKEKEYTYMLFKNNELIGTIYVKDGYIDNLSIMPEHQGEGYGKKLTVFAINKALQLQAKEIKLGVLEWNVKAIGMYKALGFEIYKRTHIYRKLLR